ncbi:hypothetical protein [Nocardiopsis tropica]|uniref:Uncharacterized protein n=1 Tax=Nocardiopsis tropica TaxID=109330 RepID=A0ABU7KNF7_9ACTN|nr:hypothetical protein [Nocardiopsis umidischolae]MEE2050830.1 hypothetical protein [Nocardiopsis umidischolae]
MSTPAEHRIPTSPYRDPAQASAPALAGQRTHQDARGDGTTVLTD